MGIASDLALALDPVLFARAVGIEPDPWQAEFLRSRSPRSLLNCSRQSGKSTAVAIAATHEALYTPDSLILLVSKAERQSGEIFRKVLATYHALGLTEPPDSETKLTIELANGSRIIALPGKEDTIRSYSGVRLLVIDEAARVPIGTYVSVRPMLAVSGGRLVALSTPFGTRGWWYEAWRSEEPWERYKIPATECPRITAQFLEEEKRNLGEWWYEQEYMCHFLDAQAQAFRREDIDRAFAEEVEAWVLA